MNPSFKCVECGTEYPERLQIHQGLDVCQHCIRELYTCRENRAHRRPMLSRRRLLAYRGHRMCARCFERQGDNYTPVSRGPSLWRRVLAWFVAR